MTDDYITSTIAVYDKVAKEYTKRAEARGPKIERSHFMKIIPEHGTILDVGCGSGRDTKVFCDHGFILTGVDLSEKLLEIAKHEAPTATFLKEDIRSMNFPVNSFDGIWAQASLLHIKHDEIHAILKTFYSIMKPNGTLYVAMKAGSGERFAQMNSTPGEKRFFAFYSKASLKEALVSAGFRVTKLYAYNDKERYPEDKKNKWWLVAFATK